MEDTAAEPQANSSPANDLAEGADGVAELEGLSLGDEAEEAPVREERVVVVRRAPQAQGGSRADTRQPTISKGLFRDFALQGCPACLCTPHTHAHPLPGAAEIPSAKRRSGQHHRQGGSQHHGDTVTVQRANAGGEGGMR